MATNDAKVSTASRMLSHTSGNAKSEKIAAFTTPQNKVAKVSAALSSASKAVGAFGKANAK